MENRYFQIDPIHKKTLIEEIRAFLKRRPEILFAYLHGSFLTQDRFRDIDLAVYLKSPFSPPLQTELELEAEFARVFKKYPIEVRVLNKAPLSFRYNVIRYGQPVNVFNEDTRCNFVEATLSHFFDFAPFRKMYLKEVLSSGI